MELPMEDVPITPADCRCARLCISAVSGGGGKTLLSLGLAGALRAAGREIVPFKKGPDYIDAAWLSLAAGRPARNLDPYFLPPEELRRNFLLGVARTRRRLPPETPLLALLEGNRGLYDGLDTQGSCSTAGLARTLGCPVVISLNCTKMTRTAAALLSGLQHFEPETPIAGVILSQTASARHESILRRAIEEYTDLTVFGALPRLADNPLPERHMGLASLAGSALTPETAQTLQKLTELIREHVDTERLLEAASAAPALSQPSAVAAPPSPDADAVRPRIGYVRDAALWFYYEENLEALEQAGAELVRLSLLVTGISLALFAVTMVVGNFLLDMPFWFDWAWVVLIVLLAPALTVFGVVFMVLVSGRSKSYMEAMQTSGYVVLPLILLFVGQFTGLFVLGPVVLLILSAVIIGLDFLLFHLASGSFNAEKLLR